MNQEVNVKVGASAPDLMLKTHLYKQFQLSQIDHKNVLLSFHPLAWTSVCAKQMKSLEENKQKLEELNTIAVGISVDPVPSKKAWADSLGIKETSLLSDFWPHGEVAKLYGIFRNKEGVSERANVIVDQFKKIQFFEVYEMNKLPDINNILDSLKTLQQ
ncbi:MAG TPA: redoxin domain-containing protein [Candidatus Acidoferrum sp.]|nr:redoxin domain-containing protein [Candidatus Acidoferrum sp.]